MRHHHHIVLPRDYWFKVLTHKNAIGNDKYKLYDDDAALILLYYKDKSIGEVELRTKDNGKRVVTHSELDTEHQGKKLGAKLYAKAIRWALAHGYKVSSSGSSSIEAQRVWYGKTIRQYVRIRIANTNAKKYRYHTVPTWFAYKK